jgi:hypothetical protein
MNTVGGGVGRFDPMVMVVEREDVTGVLTWKGLQTGTLAFERQKCAPQHKSSKEHLTAMCCGNASTNTEIL